MSYIDTLTRMYRVEVGKRTEDADHVDRKTAIAYVMEEAAALHARGEMTIPVEDLLHAALMQIDEREGAAADRVVEAFASGQYMLEIDSEAALDMVVTLGAGRRKLWRDFTAADLDELDRLRYRNVASAQAAYDRWRGHYDTLMPQLLAAGNVAALASSAVSA